MQKLELLKSRKAKISACESQLKKQLFELIDADSLVEASAFTFSKNQFFDEDALGEGVVCGFATVADTPVYVVAQNIKVLSGGVSKAQTDKICNCIMQAQEKNTPVLYLLNSLGVQVGEGTEALEGIAEVLSFVNAVRGAAPQFSVVLGDLFGSFAVIPAMCDFNFMLKDSCVAHTSPAVISASAQKSLAKAEVGGAKAHEATGITTFEVESLAEVRAEMVRLFDLLPDYGAAVDDNDDDLNRNCPELNDGATAEAVIGAVFDEDTFIELNKGFCPEVKCGFGRIGGISAAAVVLDGGENGVFIDENNARKIKEFVYTATSFGLPIVNFVNAQGISADLAVSRTQVLKEVANLVNAYSDADKISVIYGKAIGLGYSIFAAKNMGYDAVYAFCTAKVGLFDGTQGALIEMKATNADAAKLAERYSDESLDAINCAKNGYVDSIIEPEFVRQYVIASLQMLIR